ncbi:MAG: N-acetylmuramoyl-L-alanine amidase [Elusimicrobiota bacterium]|jgi:N-acetylmuramoyl-L-alanine amidase|nr:N-acetylmuramoyl-L-alanine amidase [Elusimicrobiota bacterium]
MNKALVFAFALCLPIFINSQNLIQRAPSINDKKGATKKFPLTVEYPCEGLSFKDSYPNMFVFGQVNPPSGKLKINGKDAQIYKTGAYISFINTMAGDFDINLEFDDGNKIHRYKRSIFIPAFDYRKYIDEYGFDLNYSQPKTNWILNAGDSAEFIAYGTPGQKVKMTLGRKFKSIEMRESASEPGVYKKTVVFPNDKFIKKPLRATYVMYDENGREKTRASSIGSLRILSKSKAARTAKVKIDDARMRKAAKPGNKIIDTRLFGTVKINAVKDDFYRVALNEKDIGWIEKYYLEPKARYDLPQNIVSEIFSEADERKTVITIKNSEKVSFKILELKDSFTVILYYTHAPDNRAQDIKNSFLAEKIELAQVDGNTQKITAFYRPKQVLWGYDYEYKDNDLIFRLYHKPRFNFTREKPLKNLKVFLDPGHSPVSIYKCEDAISPLGIHEYWANYKIALAAQKSLKALGADVILSKTEDEQLTLLPRSQRARKAGAQIFISVHNNALPNNVDPFAKERGFGMHYYYPHCAALARAMDESYKKNIPLISEGIIQTDLSVTRNSPQIPAILIENLYMLLPQQEELLLQEKFIDKLGAAIAQGIVNFVNPKAAKLPNFGIPTLKNVATKKPKRQNLSAKVKQTSKVKRTAQKQK